MRAYAVTKGRLVAPNSNLADLVRFKEFMFNPPDMEDTKSPIYGTLDVPGGSHPTYQYGSGGPRVFTFTLHLDGDRGWSHLRQQGPLDSGVGLSVRQEIAWYRALLYPTEYNPGAFRAVSPPIVLFSLGNYLRAVPCLMTAAAVTVNYWTPRMDPVRADIAVTLEEQPRGGGLTSSDVLREAGVGQSARGY